MLKQLQRELPNNMKLKTKDLIKILPFEEKFKTELFSEYDNLNPDQKFEIVRLLWDTYDALYELKLEENMQTALLRVENGQESLDKEFYKRIEEQTEKEMESQTTQSIESSNLTAARAAMEMIVKEIQASKKSSS